MNLTPGQLTVIVRPSIRGVEQPFTAYIAGTNREECPDGHGRTVVEAIEDLFTSEQAGRVATTLERVIAEAKGAQ